MKRMLAGLQSYINDNTPSDVTGTIKCEMYRDRNYDIPIQVSVDSDKPIVTEDGEKTSIADVHGCKPYKGSINVTLLNVAKMVTSQVNEFFGINNNNEK